MQRGDLMNFKKTILYLLLCMLLLIFVYNYIIPFLAWQNYNANSMGMGMGRHMWEGAGNIQYNYNGVGNLIIVAIAILVGLLLIDKIMYSSRKNKCKRCNYDIESNQWKICPRCGNRLHHKEED